MPRILHIQLLPILSGVQRVSVEELRRLPECYQKSLVCQSKGPLTDTCEALGVAVHYAPKLQRDINVVRDIVAFVQIYTAIRQIRPDIVHTHSSKPGLLGRLAARVAGVRIIVHTVHGFAFPATSNVLKKAFFVALEWLAARACTDMIVLNQSDADTCRDLLWKSEDRIHLITNAVDLQAYYPVAPVERRNLRQDLGLNKDAVIIGMVGRLWTQKNPLLLLDAFNELCARTDLPVELLFIGDGDLRKDLEDRLAGMPCAKRVRLLGWRKDIPVLMRSMDIFVLPSRWEGLPLVILEAMASGVPVVASNIPGNRDAVRKDYDGLLFESENTTELTSALIDLVENRARRTTMGVNARTRMQACASIDSRIERIDQLYKHGLRPVQPSKVVE